ncbi:MAG: hypothetical protein GY730_00760 [bacterium]|nr:hypothetical protein [bacterium]
MNSAESKEPESDSLKEAINRLSQKHSFLSEEAVAAKKEFDRTKHLSPDIKHTLQNKTGLIVEFEESVNLLSSIFKQSNFDELVLFLAKPGRFLTINLLIGLVRGIGFTIGATIIVLFIAYLIKASLSPELVKDTSYLLKNLFSI